MLEQKIEDVLEAAGTGRFQYRLLAVFGLVWAADAMQVLAVGFSAGSIAASFGISVPQALQTGTLFFLGMMIGAAVFGRLADRFGRRRILFVTVAMDAVFGLASAFMQDFTLLLICRFLTGLAVGGTLPVDYALMAEFLPPSKRGRWLVALEGFWAIGTLAVALTAWLGTIWGATELWRVIFLATAIPAVIGLILRLFVSESPMHLLQQGKQQEAQAVLAKVLRENGRSDVQLGRIASPEKLEKTSIFSAALRGQSVKVLAVWFLVSLSYYGVFTWMPAQLATEGFGFVRGYGFLVLLALAQIPGYILAAIGVETWGRRKTLVAFLLLSAVGTTLFMLATSPLFIGSALMLMSFALLGTWGALYAFTPELYPTSSRATAMGAAGAMARLGGLLAPSVMVYLFVQSMNVALGLFALCLLAAALLASRVLAETKGAALR